MVLGKKSLAAGAKAIVKVDYKSRHRSDAPQQSASDSGTSQPLKPSDCSAEVHGKGGEGLKPEKCRVAYEEGDVRSKIW